MNWITNRVLVQKLKRDGSEATLQDVYDGKHLVVIYPPQYAKRMLCTSFLMLIDCGVCFAFNYFDLLLLTFFTSMISLNHWKYPIIGIRRTMDLVMAQIAAVYHLYVAFSEVARSVQLYTYVAFVMIAILFYCSAVTFAAFVGNPNIASICHCMMHIIAIAGNVYLYCHIRQHSPGIQIH